MFVKLLVQPGDGITLLLKGSRTIVCERGKPISYNTTGNPGMASGGMGDVLTGVCAGLAGRELSMYDAARIGAWICGRAAEISIFQNGASEESLLASDVLAPKKLYAQPELLWDAGAVDLFRCSSILQEECCAN